MRPNAGENEQISPTTTIPVARGVDSRPHLASILQEGRKSTNIHAGSGVIWGIPGYTYVGTGHGKSYLQPGSRREAVLIGAVILIALAIIYFGLVRRRRG